MEKPKEKIQEDNNTLICLKQMKGELDVWNVIQNLYKHNATPYQRFLCKELRRFDISDIEFYIPQLCNIILHRPRNSQYLKEYISDMCAKSIHFALRVNFFFTAATEEGLPTISEQSKILAKHFRRFYGGSGGDASITGFWLDELCLISSMTRLASILFGFPEHLRDITLRYSLKELDGILSVGLYLPAVRGSEPYHCIVNFAYLDCFCLKTKTRTPYMVFAETVHLGGTFSELETSLREFRKEKAGKKIDNNTTDSPTTNPSSEFRGMPMRDMSDSPSMRFKMAETQNKPVRKKKRIRQKRSSIDLSKKYEPVTTQSGKLDWVKEVESRPTKSMDLTASPRTHSRRTQSSDLTRDLKQKQIVKAPSRVVLPEDKETKKTIEGLFLAQDNRQACPYGAGCFRKNPLHFTKYKHPHLTNHSGPLKSFFSVDWSAQIQNGPNKTSQLGSSINTYGVRPLVGGGEKLIKKLSKKLHLTDSPEDERENDEVYNEEKVEETEEKLIEEILQNENLTLEEKLKKEIEILQRRENLDCSIGNLYGDAYYINSVEEFYSNDLDLKDMMKNAPQTDWVEIEDEEKFIELPISETEGESSGIKVSREFTKIVYRELWETKKQRIKAQSVYGQLPGWNMKGVMVKSEDDLRQEQMTMQLISTFDEIFRKAELPLWLRPYEIVSTSLRTGFIEIVPDAISIDSLKKRVLNQGTGYGSTLSHYFVRMYGERNSSSFIRAQKNFVESLAAYSLVCYLLQIKDRHNGNILLDVYGHIVHIDYGFLLMSSPGNMRFETAPFKLTTEYVDLMGGQDSDMLKYFELLLWKGFLEARKHAEKIVLLVKMMVDGSTMGCLVGKPIEAMDKLQARFQPSLADEECVKFVKSLLDDSLSNRSTQYYDSYQHWTVGINP